MNIYFWRTLEGQNSTFSGQGSKVIIVVVHVGAVKKYIYVAALLEALRKEKRKDRMKLKFTTKIDGKAKFGS
jgi:hypothetical protein